MQNNEILIFFKDKRENTRNNQINTFLINENPGYTPSQIRFHRVTNNNNNNKVG